jgi:phosphotransferase system HPr (HPr) family protein
MVNKKVVINYKEGLHLRPAKDIAEAASKFSCNIFLTSGELTIDCKSILGIVELAANYKSEIIVTAEGDDENEALERVTYIIETANEEVSKDESKESTN